MTLAPGDGAFPCAEDDMPSRFVESLVLGEVADAAFAAECSRIGIRSSDCIGSPLLYLVAHAGEISGASH